MSGIQRHTSSEPCPACGGHPRLKQHAGERCVGFVGSEGWFHCSREEHAGTAKMHDTGAGPTWSHRLRGKCPCGVEHAAGEYEVPDSNGRRNSSSNEAKKEQPQRSKPANVVEIGSAAQKIVATYDYTNAKGKLLYQVVRYHPKDFRQRRPDPAKRDGWNPSVPSELTTLYQLPEVIAGLLAGDTVWIAEGEEDVKALRRAGQVATTNSGGCGRTSRWEEDHARCFKKFAQPNGEIRIVQDIDPDFDKNGNPHRKGQKHAQGVYEALVKVIPDGCRIAIYEALEGKDPRDHFAAGKRIEQFVQVWPISAEMLETDPKMFKVHMMRQALDKPEESVRIVANDTKLPEQLWWPSGIVGKTIVPRFTGVTALAGIPSAGKSIVAMSSAMEAIKAGWEVFYLNCEMHPLAPLDRAARAHASTDMCEFDYFSPTERERCVCRAKVLSLPVDFHLVEVGRGVSVEALITLISLHVTARPTLLVWDSISSYCAKVAAGDSGDPFGMAPLRDVMNWIVELRRMTHGRISSIVVSEANAEGRAKGKFVDHISDMAVTFTPDEEIGNKKKCVVTKNWWGPTGSDGDLLLHHELCRMRKESDSA